MEFSQWGKIDNIVVWGNNNERVRIVDIYEQDNTKKAIIFVLRLRLETSVNISELQPDFCIACKKQSYISLIRCEGCQHRQCIKCMNVHNHQCVICL